MAAASEPPPLGGGGGQALGPGGRALSPLCGPRDGDTYPVLLFRRSLHVELIAEALGPEWQAEDMVGFLEVQANRVGRRRRLFWLVFAAMTWTVWTIRNKMVIEHVFLRRASDSVFKLLAFLQEWHPLCRQRDRERLDAMLHDLMWAARHLHSSSSRRARP